MSRSSFGWVVVGAVLAAVILVPFFLFAADVDQFTERFLAGKPSRVVAASVLVALLAGDVVLPVPSSFVSTGAGMLLGFAGGTLVSWVGMTLGCLVGYVLGHRVGRAGAKRLVRPSDLARVERGIDRFGPSLLVVFRAVPVLAEASVVFAGIAELSLRRFLTITAVSNLGISIVYAALGSVSARSDAFVLAFAGAIVLPGVALVVARLAGRRL